MFSENKTKKYKAFSLMEMIIAIFIFSLIMTTVTTVFVKMANVRKKAKFIQKDVEDARFAMEQMAKTLRTSTVFAVNVTNTAITSAYDHSQGKCFGYQRVNSGTSVNKLQIKTGNGIKDVTTKKITGCNNWSAWTDMSEANVRSLNFDVIKSDGESVPPKVGKVTIAMRICYDNKCTGANKTDEARIQTTVSLRDYWELE